MPRKDVTQFTIYRANSQLFIFPNHSGSPSREITKVNSDIRHKAQVGLIRKRWQTDNLVYCDYGGDYFNIQTEKKTHVWCIEWLWQKKAKIILIVEGALGPILKVKTWKTPVYLRCKWNYSIYAAKGISTWNCSHSSEISLDILDPWKGFDI